MIRRTSIATCLAAAIGTLPSWEALAQISKEWGQCTGAEGVNADIIIRGCTAIIQASKDPPDRIAIALNNRGVAFKAKGDFDQALHDYDQSIRLNPMHANSYNNRGIIYRIRGDYGHAIEEYNKAISLKTNYVEAFYNRGLANIDQGNYDKAITDFDFVIRFNPSNPYALYGRGIARFKRGDAAGGTADVNAAHAIDTNIEREFDRPGAGSF